VFFPYCIVGGQNTRTKSVNCDGLYLWSQSVLVFVTGEFLVPLLPHSAHHSPGCFLPSGFFGSPLPFFFSNRARTWFFFSFLRSFGVWGTDPSARFSSVGPFFFFLFRLVLLHLFLFVKIFRTALVMTPAFLFCPFGQHLPRFRGFLSGR